ncbi:MAG: HAMP domain-containing histidine kinase [Bacteroidetes bacterium]|nr:HAMP domain-containing histidine kinase [Bacteroidota bacterium]
MKLQTKTSLNFLTFTLFVFLLGIIAFYFLLRLQVNQNINVELEKRKNNILEEISSVSSGTKLPPNHNEKILMNKIQDGSYPEMYYGDTIIFDHGKQKFTPYRQLGFEAEFNDQQYYIQIFKSLEETDNLIIRIFLIMTVLVILIIITLLIMNNFTSRYAWKVFYDTIGKLSTYDVTIKKELDLKQSDVKEFDDLNRVLLRMTKKIKNDYINLKEFTENASHEIQTPLAIINSKMELLLQSGDLTDKQLKSVADTHDAANRLSRLNKTLLLLAKIENRQFPDSSPLEPEKIIQKQLDQLEDLTFSKKLVVEIQKKEDCLVQMNPYLGEILFSNLVKNAIRHNMEGGKLEVDIMNKSLVISNTGSQQELREEDLFKRFYKASKSSESLGLGLSIVQKIAEVYGFTLSYKYKEGMHAFTIDFSSAQV